MKKPRIIIVQNPDGLFQIKQLVPAVFGYFQNYKHVCYAHSLENAEFKVKCLLNPIVKEYE